MSEHFHAVMDRAVFNLGLSVEGTSAYILLTSIVQENARPTREALLARWTSTDEKLERALAELAERNVIQNKTGPGDEAFYHPNPSSVWR